MSLDLEAIRARADAATPGPWGWRGHINGSVELRALHSGGLRIISSSHEKPCIDGTEDIGIFLRDEACDTCRKAYQAGRLYDIACERAGELDTVWVWHPAGCIKPVNEWAKAEVLQWSDHMYRDDVKDTTHPDADFIAHARQDVADLLAEVDRLRAELALVSAGLLEAGERHGIGAQYDRETDTVMVDYPGPSRDGRSGTSGMDLTPSEARCLMHALAAELVRRSSRGAR